MHDFERKTKLSTDLRAKLGNVRFPVSRSARLELRRRVCEYAAELKESGVPPERAVVEVKRVLSEAGFELTTHTKSTEAVLTPRDHLLGDVVAWCIEGYYRSSDSAG